MKKELKWLVCSVTAIAVIGVNSVSFIQREPVAVAYENPTEFVETTTYEFPTLPYMEDGYSDLKTYWEDLSAMRSDAVGMAEAAIAKYSSVITDEQKQQLRDYEASMVSASTIGYYNEKLDAFNAVVADCKSKMSTSGPYYRSGGPGVLTKSGGVNYFNGRKETWYSQRVLPGGGLDIPGRHVNAEDGTVRDGDGYICVAASDLPYGTVVETSLGMGKVYDTGCAPGTTDIYVDW